LARRDQHELFGEYTANTLPPRGHQLFRARRVTRVANDVALKPDHERQPAGRSGGADDSRRHPGGRARQEVLL